MNKFKNVFIRSLVIVGVLFVSTNFTSAQTFSIDKCDVCSFDLSASTNPVKDLNGDECALLKVWAFDDIVEVQGNTVGPVSKKGSEYWIYFTPGTKNMALMFAHHLPVTISFGNYDFKKLESKKTYIMVLSDPQCGRAQSVEKIGNEDFQIGLAYLQGTSGKKVDDEKAKQYFFKAADAGNSDAQYYLGRMYLEGIAVDQNLNKAGEWFSKASEDSHPDALLELGRLYLNDKYSGKDPDMGFVFLSYSAEAGNATAMVDMGYYYSKGKYVNKDVQKAVNLFKEAAERGNAVGQYNLALKYIKGEGVPQDNVQAFKWFEKAAKLGDAYAQYNVGVMYEKGMGVTRDLKKAVQYYKKASNQGHLRASEALLKLGKL